MLSCGTGSSAARVAAHRESNFKQVPPPPPILPARCSHRQCLRVHPVVPQRRELLQPCIYVPEVDADLGGCRGAEERRHRRGRCVYGGQGKGVWWSCVGHCYRQDTVPVKGCAAAQQLSAGTTGTVFSC
jgi:hypothetical protein